MVGQVYVSEMNLIVAQIPEWVKLWQLSKMICRNPQGTNGRGTPSRETSQSSLTPFNFFFSLIDTTRWHVVTPFNVFQVCGGWCNFAEMTALPCVVTLSAGVGSFDQWFVMAIHHDARISFEAVTKMFDGKIQSQQLSGKSGILALSWRKTFGKECEWSPDIANFLHYDSSTNEIWSIRERGCASVAWLQKASLRLVKASLASLEKVRGA